MKRWTSDIAALILRVVLGLIFIPHGYSKVFGQGGPAAFASDLPNYHIPAFLGYVSAYAEFFGAILLIVGLLTRLDAFLLACTMAGAIVLVQLPDALNGAEPGANKFFEAMKGIELPFSLFAGCTMLLLIGGGRLSLDSVLRIQERLFKKKTAAEAAVLECQRGITTTAASRPRR
jgi:putative oxidoreductase